MKKERLDIILVNKGFFSSRERARKSIMAGIIFVNDQREDKPGTKFFEDIEINIRGNDNPYVSRGGLKLEKALREFNINLNGKKAIDIGASTGGFTHCMLQNGASKVTAIDVGYGQLAWELRNDQRVICMERTNIRYVKPDNISEPADFITIDVSFISLKKVLVPACNLLIDNGEILCLVKPQFEAGREKVGKHGVVRDKETHMEVLDTVACFALDTGMYIKGLGFSPIKGPEGNIEYFLYLVKDKVGNEIIDVINKIQEVVKQSHISLN